jgi:hypothetical protein
MVKDPQDDADGWYVPRGSGMARHFGYSRRFRAGNYVYDRILKNSARRRGGLQCIRGGERRCRIHATEIFCVRRDVMKKENESSLRQALLLFATALTALGVSLGVPVKKALAASMGFGARPAPTVDQMPGRLVIIQPKFVNPSATTLVGIADQALSDNALAERIFREPDAVALQYHLSNNEKLVLHQMTREQFQTARDDAARVVADRLSRAGSMRLPAGATDARLITERMIVGRAILAAVGRSYLDAANAHACCPWSKAIELGVNSDPAIYNVVFQRPAGVIVPQPGANFPR